MNAVTKCQVVNGTYYNFETPEAVVRVLEACRVSKTRVRLHYGDRLTGHDWHEENDCEGRLSRSTGKERIPILLHNTRSTGGDAILDRCIVGIRTTGKHSEWLYKHPTYRAKVFTVHIVDTTGYKYEVHADGEAVARFKTDTAAYRYIDKVAGPLTNRL